jgi:anaerobic nitric oxide reductase transcription regulator
VRELENVISRAVLRRASTTIRGQAIVISAEQLEADVGRSTPTLPAGATSTVVEQKGSATLRESARAHQRDRVARALAEHDGNLAAAARSLGMDRGNFHRLVRRLGL